MSKLLNFVLFQLNWFACVLGAAHGYAWLGPVVFIPILLIHLYIAGDRRWLELSLICAVGVVGSVIDSLYIVSGLLHYAATSPQDWLAPLWISVMWMSFSTTFNESLAWLRQHYITALVLGALFGPLAYWAGAALGGLQWLQSPATGYTVLACAWALALPLVFWINEKLRQWLPEPAPVKQPPA
jgi:hypothetical protein